MKAINLTNGLYKPWMKLGAQVNLYTPQECCNYFCNAGMLLHKMETLWSNLQLTVTNIAQ